MIEYKDKKMNYTNSNKDSMTAYDLFSVFSVVFSACLFSFSVIGFTLYTRVGDDNYNHNKFFSDSDSDSDSSSDTDSDSDADDEYEDEEYTQEKYARLYYDELNDLEDRVLDNDDLEKLGTIVVKEKTPNGNVIMTYNNKSEKVNNYKIRIISVHPSTLSALHSMLLYGDDTNKPSDLDFMSFELYDNNQMKAIRMKSEWDFIKGVYDGIQR